MRLNLWKESAREHLDAPALDRDLTVDLLVVGGGFTGCSAALEAAGRGAAVCLLDAEEVGHGGSGRNVGLVNAGLWLPPDKVLAQLGQKAGKKLIDTLGQAPDLVFSLIGREAMECEATRRGTLHLAHSPAGLRDIAERLRQGRLHGAPLELLDAAETARRTGTAAFHGALWDPRAGTIQPLSYCRGLARAAQKKGAMIQGGSPVTRLDRSGDVWVAEARSHTIRAKAVLLATNAYQVGLAAPFTPCFTPVSYCQFATAPMPEQLRRDILPGGEGCWDTALVMSSFRTDRAGRMIVGGIGSLEGGGRQIHRSWARRKLRQLFPALGDLAFEHEWHGRIAMTADHVPKIVSFGPNAYASFGYSGRGIGPGTTFGTRAAAALLEGDPELLPIEPIPHYSERFTGAKAFYYEAGATVMHAASALPFETRGNHVR